MRIQHNIAALNSHRNLGINNAFTGKNLEKLSSGYRINRAGDDAAGLAISEKMRGQIRGLAMAEQNTSNGINLIQTAEGGLNETHAILQRMRELAVQSSNGTYDEEVDRVNLEFEFQEIKSEIDRIASSTHYNGIKLLDGSLGKNDKVPEVRTILANGTVAGQVTTPGTAQTATFTIAGAALGVGNVITMAYQDINGNAQAFTHIVTLDDTVTATANDDLIAALNAHFKDSGISVAVTGTGTAPVITLTAEENGANGLKVLGGAIATSATNPAAPAGVTVAAGGTAGTSDRKEVGVGGVANLKFLEIDGVKYQFVKEAGELEAGARAIYIQTANTPGNTEINSIVAQLREYGVNATVNATAGTIDFNAGGGNSKGLVFQIGANGGADQRVSLYVNAMDSKSIGIVGGASLASASIASRESANIAIDIITGATNMVSLQRAGLGALQNRLEHTMNNLGVTKENLTASESTIRDVDMAKEMMEFTKNQILVQASQAMLAQANQLPQGVLSLLR